MTRSPVRSVWLVLCGIAALALTTPAVQAADDPHAHHHHQLADKSPGYKRQLST